ncbi:hypothetical protein Tco_0777917 [Tanacetum coccineum]
MSEGFQAKMSRLFASIWTSWLFTWGGRVSPRIGSHAISHVLVSSIATAKHASLPGVVLPSMMLYLDVDLTIWNCNMIVLDSGCVPPISSRSTTPSRELVEAVFIMSIELPPSIYIMLTLYEAIIVVMTTGSDDGMKVSHGMLCDGTCDKFSIIALPLLLPECHD